MKRLLQITETKISKFISLYQTITKLENNEIKKYDFISRKTSLRNIGERRTDAVTMFVFNKDKTKMLLVKEFRYPINDYIIASPAGLVDDNEDIETTARRELYEEVGYDHADIDQILPAAYTSVGLSDEQVASVFMRVDDTVIPEQHLEGTEDIKTFWVDKVEAKELLTKNERITARTQLVLTNWINQ